ncbi:hypothetical protein ACP275_07G063000 [Erythranthe tilingii]
MSKNYDNWERLVAAVLLREKLRQLAMVESRDASTISSRSSSFNSSLFHDLYFPVHNINGRRHHQLSFDEAAAMNGFRRDSFRFMDNGDQETTFRPAEQNFSFDEKTGKKCYMMGARDLNISHGKSSQNWKWRFDADSRFAEVAELDSVWRLDIRAKIRTKILQPRNVYAAYLVFKIGERSEGIESAKAMIRFVHDESDEEAAKRAQVVHFHPAPKGTTTTKRGVAVERVGGWMEVEIGNFYISKGDGGDGEVEVRLLDIRRRKIGLIVEGVEFRPTDRYSETPLISKQFLLTKVLG